MKNSFAPLWTDILDSSVWLEAPHVRITWIGMIALQDADHVVRYDSFKLARRVNLPEEQVIDALRVLGEPDKRRIDPGPEEGRRILPVEGGGWKLVNGQKYVELMAAVRLRMQKARWAAKNREREKQDGEESPPVEPPANFPRTKQDAIAAAMSVGAPVDFTEKVWNKAMARGGRDAKGVAIVSWPHYLAIELAYHREKPARAPAAPVRPGYDALGRKLSTYDGKPLRSSPVT